MDELEFLEKFRQRIINQQNSENVEWENCIYFLYKNGIGMEETLKYLNFDRPSQKEFAIWFLQNKNNQDVEKFEGDILLKTDIDFWKNNGYVVIKNAISVADCNATREAILDFLEASLDDPQTWYMEHEAKEGLMVLFTKHASLEKNRNSPKIKRAFEQLYGNDKIFKTIDKVSFNPPENAHHKFLGSGLHWDVSLQLPIPFQLQGLLYLTDVDKDSGAFHCVPGFQNEIESWLKSLPPNCNPREVAIKELHSIPVLGNAGDFIIWHQALPHCAKPNKSKSPRIVQYLTYLPIENNNKSGIWI